MKEMRQAVTIKHLLQHTSGLPRHWRNFYSDEGETPPKLAETISRYGILVNAPGTQHLYTNLGYGLLAHIIEQVSRMPFSEFMRKEVFQPLGMLNTSIENESRISRPAATYMHLMAQQFLIMFQMNQALCQPRPRCTILLSSGCFI
jgi:CubicO group peptidase (beta-lactamase class C family)